MLVLILVVIVVFKVVVFFIIGIFIGILSMFDRICGYSFFLVVLLVKIILEGNVLVRFFINFKFLSVMKVVFFLIV